jgi:hypothetical protein
MDPFILGRIGNALRRQFDDIATEPLPVHLVELINLLKQQEHGQALSGVPSSNLPLMAFIAKARHRLIELQQTLKDTQREIRHIRRLLIEARDLVAEQ